MSKDTAEIAVRGGIITTSAVVSEESLQAVMDIAEHSREAHLANQAVLRDVRADFEVLSRKLHKQMKHTSCILHRQKRYLDRRGGAAEIRGEICVTPELRGQAVISVDRPGDSKDVAVGCNLARLDGNAAADQSLN